MSESGRTLLIAGGGTGGHVFPALAVAREWMARPAPQGLEGERGVVFVGTGLGLEAKLVPQAGFPLEKISVAGLKGIGGVKFFRNLAKLPAALLDSERILHRHRFAAAFGVGGYASGPVMLLARLHGIPSVIFEPNVEPGFANRILARTGVRIACGFQETSRRFGSRAVVTGIPVRSEFFKILRRDHMAPFRLLITGGSRGAHPINQAVIDSVDLLAPKKDQLFVVHQTGERDYNAVRVAYARREIQAEVLPFIENMAERFAQADLIVCRSGAITVAELAAAGRAAILIPFGAATDAHQSLNAQAMQSAGAARLLPQTELTPQRLMSEVLSLLDQPRRITEMESCARSLARPHAVADLVSLLDEPCSGAKEARP
ncbi:MAG TPA: undecaprenyldiphospho-muramoylpentapeptide beta-N-acetylglucosaminyltransferase [Candidatus Acidoferrum sp.]|nr:undecaprenyldiphospho-muramoylpentapeptide beta-N-acetylglucosaminyltransferase [Candidatus Acidoferrum sp.]